MPDDALYEICVDGRLDERWVDWLGSDATCETAIGPGSSSMTRIVGRFDQSSLHGFLRRLPDLGMVLISLERLPEASPAAQATAHSALAETTYIPQNEEPE